MMSKRSKLSVVGAHNLFDHLLIQILSLLPAKSLRRFQCVSKGWNRLISHVLWHRKTLLPISGFFIQGRHYVPISADPENYREEFVSRLSSLPCYETSYILHSCNGLLLFTPKQDRVSPCRYYVWNPATMECVALPNVPTRAFCRRDCFLAYDPRASPHYKVVRFSSANQKSTHIVVEIYSSTTGMWAKFSVPSQLPVDLRCWNDMAAFHKGDLYLLTSYYFDHLVRFDIEKGSFRLIKLPEKRNEYWMRIACIGESRGHLYFAVNLHKQFELKIYVFEGLNTGKWQLMHTMSTKTQMPYCRFQPIAFHPELELIYLSIPNKILSYNPCSGKLEEVQETGYETILDWAKVHFVYPCPESISLSGSKFLIPFSIENNPGTEEPHPLSYTMSKRSKRSVTGAHQLIDDLLVKVFSCLPTKSLRKFQCVSKCWNDLISHVLSQRNPLLPLSGFYIYYPHVIGGPGFYVPISPDNQHYGEEFMSRLRSLPFYDEFYMLHSCNGLLLFTRKRERSPCLYYVWNPTTMEFVALPEVPGRMYCRRDCFLAYDPHKSPQYKVVRFSSSSQKSTHIVVEIYSSTTERWAKFSVPSQYPIDIRAWFDMSVFHEGSLYLLTDDDLVRFDVERGSFHLIKLPEKQPEYRIIKPFIGKSRGHLLYTVNSNKLRIYMLEELDTIKWRLVHKIRTTKIISHCRFQPIAFHPETEVVYLSIPRKILSYHLSSGKLEEVHVFDSETILDWTSILFVFPCLESIDPSGSKLINTFTRQTTSGLKVTVSETGSSCRRPKSVAADTVFDHDLQEAIDTSLHGFVNPQPIVPASNLDKVLSPYTQSFRENRDSTETYRKASVGQPASVKHVSVQGNPGRGKSIEETSDTSVTSGVIRPGTEGPNVSTRSISFSNQGTGTLWSMASSDELEELLSELKRNALIPSMRPNQQEKSEDELTEEWANVCSHISFITSYLAVVKAKMKRDTLASRLDSLKALKTSFDCSHLIRCFDRLLYYAHVLEKNNLDVIECNPQRGYASNYQLQEDTKNRIAEKSMLVDAAASHVTESIVGLERKLKNSRDRITDLRKSLAEEEAVVESINASLETENLKEAVLHEKALIVAEQAVLELGGEELEKIKDLVKQLAVSLSEFDLMGAPSS